MGARSLVQMLLERSARKHLLDNRFGVSPKLGSLDSVRQHMSKVERGQLSLLAAIKPNDAVFLMEPFTKVTSPGDCHFHHRKRKRKKKNYHPATDHSPLVVPCADACVFFFVVHGTNRRSWKLGWRRTAFPWFLSSPKRRMSLPVLSTLSGLEFVPTRHRSPRPPRYFTASQPSRRAPRNSLLP